jgi:hypothetical protein
MTTIKTNNVKRELLSGYDLTLAERSKLDYIGDADDHATWNDMVDRFFYYQGELYDLQDFVIILPRSRATGFAHGVDDDSPLLHWDGIMTDSFFSAIVVRFVRDCGSDMVIAGLALS